MNDDPILVAFDARAIFLYLLPFLFFRAIHDLWEEWWKTSYQNLWIVVQQVDISDFQFYFWFLFLSADRGALVMKVKMKIYVQILTLRAVLGFLDNRGKTSHLYFRWVNFPGLYTEFGSSFFRFDRKDCDFIRMGFNIIDYPKSVFLSSWLLTFNF